MRAIYQSKIKTKIEKNSKHIFYKIYRTYSNTRLNFGNVSNRKIDLMKCNEKYIDARKTSKCYFHRFKFTVYLLSIFVFFFDHYTWLAYKRYVNIYHIVPWLFGFANASTIDTNSFSVWRISQRNTLYIQNIKTHKTNDKSERIQKKMSNTLLGCCQNGTNNASHNRCLPEALLLNHLNNCSRMRKGWKEKKIYGSYMKTYQTQNQYHSQYSKRKFKRSIARHI